MNTDVIIEALRVSMTGQEPPADLVNRIGGWEALVNVAPELVDDPLLAPLVSLLLRDLLASGSDPKSDNGAERAAIAICDAVLGSSDPVQFAGNLEQLCDSGSVLPILGSHLAAGCFDLAAPLTAHDTALASQEALVVRRSSALEILARLTVQGFHSKYKLFTLLERVTAPQPLRYAQAVVRVISLSVDHWEVDDELIAVIDVLTGERPAKGTKLPNSDDFHRDIAPDALWAKSNISLARGLRSPNHLSLMDQLSKAIESLDMAVALTDRPDVQLLRRVLVIVTNLLESLSSELTPQRAEIWRLSADDVDHLTDGIDELSWSMRGLGHWSGDRKTAVLNAWRAFLSDLVGVQKKLQRDSLYDAAVAVDDILAVYDLSRGYDVMRGGDGVEAVMRAVRPAISKGFAARAGLYRHLSDHVAYLKTRDGEPDTAVRLSVAEAVLEAANLTLMASGPPEKHLAEPAPLPPLLRELLGPHQGISLEGPQSAINSLEASLADLQASTDRDPDLVMNAVRREMLERLASSEDFTNETSDGTTRVLDQLIRFVARRLNTQESSKAYLFDPHADEHDLHVDLYDWLSQGQLASASNVEVQEVGAGRVDIQVQFSGYHLYLELKVDETAVPIAKKNAYIKQTVTYQATDIRIGFLVVLRLRQSSDKSPSPHLKDLVTHAEIDLDHGSSPRHIVMLEIPGNQMKPSSVR